MRNHTAFLTKTAVALSVSLLLGASSHAQDIGLGGLGGISVGGLGSGDPSVSANIGGDGGVSASVGASAGGGGVGAGVSASVGGGGGLGASASANVGGGGVGANASVGGGGGLGANVSANVGGGGVGANASVGLGGNTASVGVEIGTPGTPGTPGVPGGPTGGGTVGNGSFAPGSVFSRLSSADIKRFRTRCIEVSSNPYSYDRNLVAMCRLLQQSAMR